MVSAYLAIHDAQGKFLGDLQASQVTIQEGENILPVASLKLANPGVQVVVAINPGSSFAIRNAQATSRYDLLKEALITWAKSRQGSTIDDWSYLITNGTAVSHTSDPAQWFSGLESDQTDMRTAQPSLDTLSRAVSMAADSTNRPGMAKAVLFITAPIDGQLDQALKDISDMALQQDVTIFMWMVASSGAVITQSAEKLQTLVSSTGGQSFFFSGDEGIPSPEDFLGELRSVYQVEYQSKASSSGERQFALQIQVGDESIQSNPLTFNIELQPPEPAFISPPISIDRKLPEEALEALESAALVQKNPAELLSPREIVLQVVFDFPDGRLRDLAKSALLVDGVVVAENLAPPFDRFTWNLDSYTTDGLHKLQVQVNDILGMTGTSIETPVQITVERPEADPIFTVKRNLPVISGIIVLLAGSILFLVLVLGGYLRPGSQRAARARRKPDPVTQPIHIENETSARRLPGWVSRLQGRQQQESPRAIAFLKPISDAENAGDSPPIPITTNEVTLGSDPNRASLVLVDPCVESLHARLVLEEPGIFRLTDEGSVAGTWVNYTPITQRGVNLEHGDLVHIGRIGFRFIIRQPTQARKLVVTLENPSKTMSEEPEEVSEELIS